MLDDREIFRGSLTHPTHPLCTLRGRRRRRLTQHSLPGCLLGIAWVGLAPTDRANFAWRLPIIIPRTSQKRPEPGWRSSPRTASNSRSPPPTAPVNLIEGFFSKLARSVLRHIRVASKQELNRMATYCPRTARRSSYHLPVPSALWRTGSDQTAVRTRQLRIRCPGPTRRLIRELSGMDD